MAMGHGWGWLSGALSQPWGKPACDEGSHEGQWNYRQSRILSDKHEIPDLSTLLYELRRFLILKATWSLVSVPSGRKHCNGDNLWTSLSGLTPPEHVICPSPKAGVTSSLGSLISTSNLRGAKYLFFETLLPLVVSSEWVATLATRNTGISHVSFLLSSHPINTFDHNGHINVLFFELLSLTLKHSVHLSSSLHVFCGHSGPSRLPLSPARLQWTLLGPLLCVPYACQWSFFKSVILSLVLH